MNSSTQEYLFEHKTDVPEHIYINLMNNLKIDMIQKQRRFVMINYIHLQSHVDMIYDDFIGRVMPQPRILNNTGKKILLIVNEMINEESDNIELSQRTNISREACQQIKHGIDTYGFCEHILDSSDQKNKYFIVKIEEF